MGLFLLGVVSGAFVMARGQTRHGRRVPCCMT